MNQPHFGGKRGSRRHSTTGFSKNVVVAKTSYHKCYNFIILPSGEGLRADVSKYRPEVYKSEKSKILKKIHKVALGKLLTKM